MDQDFSKCASCKVEDDGTLVCIKDGDPGSWITYSVHARVVAERDKLLDELAALQDVCNALTKDKNRA